MAEAQEKWDVYYILPDMTSYYNDPAVINCWRRLLGQNAIKLPDPAGISEMIASLVGLAEGAAATADVERHLKEAGASRKVLRAVREAITPLAAGRA